jgi:hypothetical protein
VKPSGFGPLCQKLCVARRISSQRRCMMQCGAGSAPQRLSPGIIRAVTLIGRMPGRCLLGGALLASRARYSALQLHILPSCQAHSAGEAW